MSPSSKIIRYLDREAMTRGVRELTSDGWLLDRLAVWADGRYEAEFVREDLPLAPSRSVERRDGS